MRTIPALAITILLGACSARHDPPSLPADAPAAIRDAPAPPDGPPRPVELTGTASPDKVACAAATCDTATQHCCGSSSMTPTCTATCSSPIDLVCDGPEDCPTGQTCCGTPSMTGLKAVCAATCGMDQPELCHNSSQCPTSAPKCCGGPGAGFGGCSPATAC